jgi:hypothetical protein
VELSVAPSGNAVIGWRHFVESYGQLQFTVRVRASAGAPWGPAQALSTVSNRIVDGDVAVNDDGTAMAAWTACRHPSERYVRTCKVQRSG